MCFVLLLSLVAMVSVQCYDAVS